MPSHCGNHPITHGVGSLEAAVADHPQHLVNGDAAMDSTKDPMIPLSCLETLKSKI